MSEPPSLTKYTSECYHCQEMFSEHSTELLLFKMHEHNKKSHNLSDVSPEILKIYIDPQLGFSKPNIFVGELSLSQIGAV